MRLSFLLCIAVGAVAQQVEWSQTALFKDDTTDLLKEMKPITFSPMALPSSHALVIDSSVTYQEILGFGGAFTEAAAINWRKLSLDDQAEVIRLYFASPEEGGHGYTVGRVPINSCDFSPGSYSFDDESDDEELSHFDTSVTHDVKSGMIPMIQQAQAAAKERGAKLTMFASPWSPPAWMKLPVDGKQAMTVSAKPNGLMPSKQRAWAKYFSKFISAYRSYGINMWGVTVQNEPEAAVGWEAMLWTPEFMAEFVKNHLGPVLRDEQPGVKIIGFDHNKDHVLTWAKGLYADPEAAAFFAGIGVHWYGGLNTDNLNSTHWLAPDKFILGTEACNCGGVVYKTPSAKAWWSRAEALALDILEDLRFWAVGWTDWNLVLGTDGGPNHLKNLCDANIIIDPDQSLGMGTLVMQATYYFMGHFSRFIPPGSKQVKLKNSVALKQPALSPADVKNGQPLLFAACSGEAVQSWGFKGKALVASETDTTEGSDGYMVGGECLDVAMDAPPKIQTWACNEWSHNQHWSTRSVPGGSQVVNEAKGYCMTAVVTSGSAVGLDRGVTVTAAQALPCLAPGTANQTFLLSNDDGPLRTKDGLCLQPQIARLPHFDAVGFKTPDGGMSLVLINVDDKPIQISIYDAALGAGVTDHFVPSHSMQSFRWGGSLGAAASVAGIDLAEGTTAAAPLAVVPTAVVPTVVLAEVPPEFSPPEFSPVVPLLSIIAALSLVGVGAAVWYTRIHAREEAAPYHEFSVAMDQLRSAVEAHERASELPISRHLPPPSSQPHSG